MRPMRLLMLVGLIALPAACSVPEGELVDLNGGNVGGSNQGGTQASGGGANLGGVTNGGNSSSQGATGGSSAPGGASSSGGTSNGGLAGSGLGGTGPAQGGASAITTSGGNSGVAATGGAVPTGGVTSIGGTYATGGTTTAGGVSPTGGTRATGGALQTGGDSPTGGTGATAGISSTGGVSPMAGSHATGGVAGGFSPTGGTRTTGGMQPTGGVSSTSGAASGIPGTGGASSTGGTVATGGAQDTGGLAATGGTTSTGLTCDAGTEDCDQVASNGCEQDVNSDVNHCGSCTKVCPSAHATPACSSGTCSMTCVGLWGDCNTTPSDGCEKDLSGDTSNCGACNKTCSNNHGTPACSSGGCSISCIGLWGNCDGNITNGCEKDVSSDAANCGFCGHACPTAQPCVSGVCQTPCSGICSNPLNFTIDGANPYKCTFNGVQHPSDCQSPQLGTGAACWQTTSAVQGGMGTDATRTYSVNGTAQSGANWIIPASRNGGYCISTTTGSNSWATFTVSGVD